MDVHQSIALWGCGTLYYRWDNYPSQSKTQTWNILTKHFILLHNGHSIWTHEMHERSSGGKLQRRCHQVGLRKGHLDQSTYARIGNCWVPELAFFEPEISKSNSCSNWKVQCVEKLQASYRFIRRTSNVIGLICTTKMLMIIWCDLS